MSLPSRIASRLPEGLLVRLTSLAYRRFEPEITHLDEVCGRGGTMVDIGGWYGPWTRRLVHRATRVVVIEPTLLHEVLRRTLPPTVDLIAAAASDHRGKAEIWLPSSDGATQGVSSLHRRDVHSTSTTVPLVTVDGLDLRDVTFIKIDVDGHEIPVLHGAAETVKRDKPRLLVEVEQRIQPAADVTGLLESWGYRGWVLPGREWVPVHDFPLAAHQAKTDRAADRGLLARALWPFPRYVNSVLFLPGDQIPGPAALPRLASRSRNRSWDGRSRIPQGFFSGNSPGPGLFLILIFARVPHGEDASGALVLAVAWLVHEALVAHC